MMIVDPVLELAAWEILSAEGQADLREQGYIPRAERDRKRAELAVHEVLLHPKRVKGDGISSEAHALLWLDLKMAERILAGNYYEPPGLVLDQARRPGPLPPFEDDIEAVSWLMETFCISDPEARTIVLARRASRPFDGFTRVARS